jgi:flagellar motor switch/type III secretory pathway protein FliN
VTVAAPLDLPTIEADALPLLNGLAGVARSLSLAVGSEQFSVRFTAPTVLASALAAAIDIAERRFWLALSDWNQLVAVADVLEGEPLDRVPATILPAVLSAALENNLDQFAQAAQSNCELTAVEPLDRVDAELLRLGVELTGAEGKTVRGLMIGDAGAMGLLRDAVQRVAPAAARSCGALPMVAGVEIGLTQLAFDDLRSLRPGDVVLLDVAAPRDKPTGLLRLAPTATWRVGLAGDHAKLIGPVKLTHWGRDGAAGRVAALVFEQGRVELSAEQVAQLAPEAELPIVDADKIVIRNGGRVVGAGELVHLGARTGVRIQTWPVG